MKRNFCIGLFIALVAAVAIISLSSNHSYITVVNTGNVAIANITITLSRETQYLTSLKPNEKRALRFLVHGDASYVVSVTFENGKKLNQEVGYVTSGMDFHEVICISPQKVTIIADDR
jgi:hypothetical protein